MLLTSTQVSWAVSAGIITFFTFALFLSGYVLQRQTVSSLREAIPDIPNKQILAQAALARDSIPVPTVDNPRFRGSSASRNKQQQQVLDNGGGGGVHVATDDEEGVNVDVQVLEVEEAGVVPGRGEMEHSSGGGRGDDNGPKEARQRDAAGSSRESSRRAGNGGSVGAAAMNARGPVRRPVGWPGGANGGKHAQTHDEGNTAEAARKRHEWEQTKQMAAAVDPNDALVRAGLDEFSVGRGSRSQSGAKKKEGEEVGTGKQHDKYKAQKANHYEDHGPFDAGGTLISIREDGVHAIDMRQQQRERQRGL